MCFVWHMRIFESGMGMSRSLILSQARNYQDQWHLEQYARAIRERLRLTQFDILDPWKLADALPAHVFYLEDVVPPELVLKAYQANWDGFAFQFPRESILMVILNSAKQVTRQSATSMQAKLPSNGDAVQHSWSTVLRGVTYGDGTPNTSSRSKLQRGRCIPNDRNRENRAGGAAKQFDHG